MTKINSVAADPIPVANGGTGAATLTSGGVCIGAGTSAVSATLTPSGLTSLASGTLSATTTVTAGTDITSTAGNVIVSGAAKGLSLNVTTASGAASGTVNCNGRAGSVTFTSPSTAGGADSTLVLGNTSITGSGTVVLYNMRGCTTGGALTIKSVVNSANTSTIVVTNGTALTTSTADITFDFLVLN